MSWITQEVLVHLRQLQWALCQYGSNFSLAGVPLSDAPNVLAQQHPPPRGLTQALLRRFIC